MSLSTTAAQVMSLAQDGQAQAALQLAEQALSSSEAEPAGEQASLWYTIAVTHHVRQDPVAQLAATDRCLELGQAAGEPGWTSNALSMRAMALARSGAIEPALLDIARSEVDLSLCTDPGLRCWAHTGLGYCYLELRLYELALPHLEAAQRLSASPIPLPEAPTVDLMNLAELHLRWADELERVASDVDLAAVRRHRAVGHAHAMDAVAAASLVGAASLLAASRAMELCSRSADDAAASLEQLRAAFSTEDHRDYQGARPQVGGALARALWQRRRPDEAIEVARASVELSQAAGDWQIGASARWLLVELQAQAGLPGAEAGRAYGRQLSEVLWRQRLSTLQGARAALDVERLRRANVIAVRAAAEDPLTGVGNRRLLTEALEAAVQAHAAAPAGPEVGPRPALSLLLVDLDDFKAVNDRHGHVVGDQVLRAVADVLRSTARTEDVVARLGGDEFVVLAKDADEAAGRSLAERVSAAIAAVHVESGVGSVTLRASVGVATTGADVSVADLLERADVAMYRSKGRTHHPVPGLRGA